MKKLVLGMAIFLLAASCDFSNANVGIIKTANGGSNWQQANKIKNSDQTLLKLSISQVRYDNQFENLYASSFDGGLYKSADAGESWEEVLGVAQVYDFAFNPNDNKIIYAATFLNSRGRILVTKDQGKSWTEIYSDASKDNPVRTVAINPLNPQEILAGLGRGSIIHSGDGGQTWKLVANYNDRIYRIVWNNGVVYAVVKSTGVMKSLDGGQSFQQITGTITNSGNILGVSIFGENTSDYRQIAIGTNNPNLLYLTTNNGLYKTQDGGSTWNYVSMPYRQDDTSPYAVAMASGNDFVVYSSVGSIIYKSVDGGATWTANDTGTNGLITVIEVDHSLPQIAFAGVSK